MMLVSSHEQWLAPLLGRDCLYFLSQLLFESFLILPKDNRYVLHVKRQRRSLLRRNNDRPLGSFCVSKFIVDIGLLLREINNTEGALRELLKKFRHDSRYVAFVIYSDAVILIFGRDLFERLVS